MINDLVYNYFVLITQISYHITFNHNLMKFGQLIICVNVFICLYVQKVIVKGSIKLKQITRYIYIL